MGESYSRSGRFGEQEKKKKDLLLEEIEARFLGLKVRSLGTTHNELTLTSLHQPQRPNDKYCCEIQVKWKEMTVH